MSDKEWIGGLDKIDDPKEALRIILENEMFLGYDPYYGELRAAMLNMAERIASKSDNE